MDGASTTVTLGGKALFVDMYDTSQFGTDVVLTCADACSSSADEQIVCYPESSSLVFGVGATETDQQNDLCTKAGETPGTAACTTYLNNFCGKTYTSRNVFGYCLPTSNSAFVDNVNDALGGVQWTRVFDSITRAWAVILASLLVALVLGFVYMFLMERCAKPITYFSMAFILVALIIGGVFLMQRALDIKDTFRGDNSDGYKEDRSFQLNFGGSIATFVLAGLYLCFIVFMFSRIKLATNCVINAGESIRKGAPMLVFFAIFIVLFGIGITAVWAVTAVYLFSAGEVQSYTPPGGTAGVLKTVELEDDLRYSIYYHIFGYFWVTQFLVAFVELVIALAITRWYFAPEEADGKKQGLPPSPVSAAVSIACKYHLGSVAFGSLIIAIVKAIRAVFEYVTAKYVCAWFVVAVVVVVVVVVVVCGGGGSAWPSHFFHCTVYFAACVCGCRLEKNGGRNPVFRCLRCCCSCCLWCLEKCLRFINRQAYIQIAITGESFCTSARAAFSLVLHNLARFGALTVVATLFLILGRLFVAGGATLIAYGVLTKMDRYTDETR